MQFGQYMTDVQNQWEARGIPSVYSGGAMDPVNMLAIWRSTSQFLLDIRYRYDKVRKVVHDILMPDFLKQYKEACAASGCKICMVPSATYIMPVVNRDVFEDLNGDWVTGCTDILLEMDKVPMYHLDSNWDETLSWYKKFPKGKCIIHLGGESNIFKAKEILAGHMCLMGDALFTKMQVASPDEITAYYKKRVDVIGADNGYIISNGCFLSAHSKIENVKAMVAVAKNYKPR